jgi:hypothetical protein
VPIGNKHTLRETYQRLRSCAQHAAPVVVALTESFFGSISNEPRRVWVLGSIASQGCHLEYNKELIGLVERLRIIIICGLDA